MAQIILDMGSGRSCGNSKEYAEAMIRAVKAVDTGKHEVILKWQLFKNQPPNIPLDPMVFDWAYEVGKKLGYQVTSSVFDKESLHFLLNYDIPFVKIACRPDLYWLIGEVPRRIPLYISYDPRKGSSATLSKYEEEFFLICVPEYPARLQDYGRGLVGGAYSDHTQGLELFQTFRPAIWEKHFVLEREPDNPDAGLFAVTPEELKEVL